MTSSRRCIPLLPTHSRQYCPRSAPSKPAGLQGAALESSGLSRRGHGIPSGPFTSRSTLERHHSNHRPPDDVGRLIRIRSFFCGSKSLRWRLQPTWQSLRFSSAQPPPFESGRTCSIVAALPTFGIPAKRMGWPQRQQVSPSRARTSFLSFAFRPLNCHQGGGQNLAFFAIGQS